MGNVKVKIDAIKGNNNIDSVTVESPNNISGFKGGTYKGSEISTETKGGRPFIVGSSKLGKGDVFSNYYDGYMSNIFSSSTQNSEGYYDVSFQLLVYLTSNTTKSFTIVFDKVVNQFATKLSINGEVFTNDDTTFVYYNDNMPTTLDIQFLSWNVANVPVRFTYLSQSLSLTYTSENGLMEIIRGSQKLTDISAKPEYGVLSQYGTLRIYDYDTQLEDLADLNLLSSKIPISVYLDEKLVGKYTSSNNWTKDDNDLVNITLEDDLVYWKDKYLPGIDLDIAGNNTMLNMLKYLVSQSLGVSEDSIDLVNNEYFDITQEFVDWCNSIKVYYYYLKSDTLLNCWNNFCAVTQSKVFVLESGKIAVRRQQ